MKKTSLFLILILLLTACNAAPPEPTYTPTSPPSATATQTSAPTFTPSPQPTATETQLPPTETPLPENSPLSTLPPVSSPFVEDLVANGYEHYPIVPFHAFFSADEPENAFPSGWSLIAGWDDQRFGGPRFDIPNPADSLSVDSIDGNTYYMQFYHSSQGDYENCVTLFYQAKDAQADLIFHFDLNQESDYRRSVVENAEFSTTLFCNANGWDDVNRNGYPDIAVSYFWGDNYWNSELHIFEARPEGEIVQLTKNLPGPVSLWDYWTFGPMPLFVIDAQWKTHDCLYPGVPFSNWFYVWDEEQDSYVDFSANPDLNLDFFADQYRRTITASYSQGFYPDSVIGPLASLLLLYDKAGLREQGWQEYLTLSDLDNWSELAPEAREWLEYDLSHFEDEYNANIAFTPGSYPGGFCP